MPDESGKRTSEIAIALLMENLRGEFETNKRITSELVEKKLRNEWCGRRDSNPQGREAGSS